MTFEYRPEVLDELLRHGAVPTLHTDPQLVRDWLSAIQLPNTGSGVGTGRGLLTTLAYGALLAALALTTIGLARRMIDSPTDSKRTRR